MPPTPTLATYADFGPPLNPQRFLLREFEVAMDWPLLNSCVAAANAALTAKPEIKSEQGKPELSPSKKEEPASDVKVFWLG